MARHPEVPKVIISFFPKLPQDQRKSNHSEKGKISTYHFEERSDVTISYVKSVIASDRREFCNLRKKIIYFYGIASLRSQ
jgi:hypothetical protein